MRYNTYLLHPPLVLQFSPTHLVSWHAKYELFMTTPEQPETSSLEPRDARQVSYISAGTMRKNWLCSGTHNHFQVSSWPWAQKFGHILFLVTVKLPQDRKRRNV